MAGKYITSDSDPGSRSEFWLGLAFLYLLGLRAYYVGFFNDDAFYIIGARSIAQGRYAALNQPGEPPLIQYMPGYPMLLAPLALWLDYKIAYQLASVAMTLGALWLFRKYFLDTLSAHAATAAWIVSALNPLTVSLSGAVLSDIPYLLLSGAVLVYARECWKHPTLSRQALLAGLAAFSCLIRPVGAAFSLALAAAWAMEAKRKAAGLSLLILALLVAPFLMRNYMASGQALMYVVELTAPYRDGNTPAALWHNIIRNSTYYLRDLFVHAMFRWPENSGNWLLGPLTVIAASLFCIFGAAQQKPDGFTRFTRIYLLLYAAVHLVWAKRSGRYLLPLLPLVFGYFFQGLAALEKLWSPRLPILWAALALSLTLNLKPLTAIVRASIFQNTPITTPPQRTFSWILENTNPRDIFAAELDGQLYLHTGRQSVRLRKAHNPKEFAQWLKARRVRYVLTLPTDFILRTPSGASVHDPWPASELEGILSEIDARTIFRDYGEGSTIYRMPNYG